MLIEKDEKFLISDCTDLYEIRDFLKKNRNNPNISRKVIDELYSLYVLLFYLHDSEYFTLPIHILKTDPPDFVVEKPGTGHKSGIEILSSGTQTEKHAFDIMVKKYPEGSLLEKPYYAPGLNFESTVGIRKPGEPLKSDGFGNFGQEIAWLDCIYECLNSKILNLNKQYFPKYTSNQLIVYDDSGYFAKPDYILPKIRKEYKLSHNINFDSIHIIMNVCHLLIADVFGRCISFNIPLDFV